MNTLESYNNFKNKLISIKNTYNFLDKKYNYYTNLFNNNPNNELRNKILNYIHMIDNTIQNLNNLKFEIQNSILKSYNLYLYHLKHSDKLYNNQKMIIYFNSITTYIEDLLKLDYIFINNNEITAPSINILNKNISINNIQQPPELDEYSYRHNIKFKPNISNKICNSLYYNNCKNTDFGIISKNNLSNVDIFNSNNICTIDNYNSCKVDKKKLNTTHKSKKHISTNELNNKLNNKLPIFYN